MGTLNRPIPFQGTPEEAEANYHSHTFSGEDDRCFACDCKPWHKAADYPCGVEPPRETVEYP